MDDGNGLVCCEKENRLGLYFPIFLAMPMFALLTSLFSSLLRTEYIDTPAMHMWQCIHINYDKHLEGTLHEEEELGKTNRCSFVRNHCSSVTLYLGHFHFPPEYFGLY